MYKNLVLKAFQKARNEVPGKTNKTRLATHISDILLNEYRHQICERQLRNLFNVSEKCDPEEDISISSLHIQYLCNFLSLTNYDHFLTVHPNKSYAASNTKVSLPKKSSSVIVMFSFTLLLFSFTITINPENILISNTSSIKKFLMRFKNIA